MSVMTQVKTFEKTLEADLTAQPTQHVFLLFLTREIIFYLMRGNDLRVSIWTASTRNCIRTSIKHTSLTLVIIAFYKAGFLFLTELPGELV